MLTEPVRDRPDCDLVLLDLAERAATTGWVRRRRNSAAVSAPGQVRRPTESLTAHVDGRIVEPGAACAREARRRRREVGSPWRRRDT